MPGPTRVVGFLSELTPSLPSTLPTGVVGIIVATVLSAPLAWRRLRGGAVSDYEELLESQADAIKAEVSRRVDAESRHVAERDRLTADIERLHRQAVRDREQNSALYDLAESYRQALVRGKLPVPKPRKRGV